MSVGGNFHLACSVGRLVEVRLERLQTVAAVSHFGSTLVALLRELGKEAVLCADWRRLSVLSPDVADAMGTMMRGTNPRVVRSAALIGEHATFGLQMERVVRATNNPARKVFRNSIELLSWLGAVSSPEENERARQFLLESA